MKKQNKLQVLLTALLLLFVISNNSYSQQCNADFSYSYITVDSLQFTDLSTCSSGSCIVQWLWDFDDGQTHTLQNPTHQYLAAGTYIVNLTIFIDSMGYVQSCNVTIPVSTTTFPTAIFSTNSPVCPNSEVDFDDNSTTPDGYITQWDWDFGDGTTQTILYPNNPDVSHTYTTSGTYDVELTITNSINFTDSTIQTINILAQPVADFTYVMDCVEDPVLFTDLSSTNGGSDLVSWHWEFDDPGSGSNNTSTLQNPAHTYTNNGSYDVELFVINSQGCSDTIISSVELSDPGLDFTYMGDCFGSTTFFEVDATVTNINEVLTWNWDFGDGFTSNLQNPSHNYAVASGYNVTLSILTINNCTAEIVHNVIINQLPSVEITANTNMTNVSVPIQFYGNSATGGIISWYWEFGDGSFSTLQNPVYQYQNYGIYNVTLDVIDMNGCLNIDTAEIQIIPPPVFPDSLAIWNTIGYSYGTEELRFRYGLIGDTVLVNGKNRSQTYSIVYELYDSTLSIHNSTYFGATRTNSDNQVFLKVPELPETILYDYSKEVGDTIWYNLGGAATLEGLLLWETDHYKVITAVDSVLLLDNKYHTRWFLQGPLMSDTWIENVGSVEWFGLFNPLISDITTNGNSFSFACFKQNEIPLYIDNPDCDKCFCYLLTKLEEISAYDFSKIIIYPNPAKDEINLVFDDNSNTIHEINIFNSSGQLVHGISYGINETARIDIKDWPKGIYFLTINDKFGMISNEKFVIE